MAVACLNSIKPRGIVSPEELKKVDALTTAPVVLGNVESKGRRAGVFTSDNYRVYDTWQFNFKRKARVMASYPVNDFDLYHIEIDRVKPVFVDSAGNVLSEDEAKAIRTFE